MNDKKTPQDKKEQRILITGGAGFIGSHTCVELLKEGYRLVVLDDLSNSHKTAIKRIREIVSAKKDDLIFYEGSVLDKEMLRKVFNENRIDAIIHFAGLKSVEESIRKPLKYYHNNLTGTINVCNAAEQAGIKKFIFSSSATVYGEPKRVPVTEEDPKMPALNPYGQTKNMAEQILADLVKSDSEWNIVILRYFNPIGAHESGLIGEDPRGIPNNLVPYVSQVAAGTLDSIKVYGNDYDTKDGTGVRDYIHVVDLARGHVSALKWMNANQEKTADSPRENSRQGLCVFNLGTGKGSSVLEVIHAYEAICNKELPFEMKPRREGDVASCFASCEKANLELGWFAKYDLMKMCEDSWRWQTKNPNGYGPCE